MNLVAPAEIADFEQLLAPASLDEFFAVYWNRQPLRIVGPRDRFAGLFSRAAFEAALPRCGHLKAGFYDRKGWFCDFAITPAQVKRLWEAEMTICAGVLPAEGALAAMIAAYRRMVAFAGDIYFNAYMSPEGQGFGLHVDDHPVWILQIEGAKRWSISRGIGVPEPPRGFSFPPDRHILKTPWGTYERPDETQFLEFTLEPGDMLYLPAGTWHKAKASGYSLGLTLAAGSHTGLDLARAAIVEGVASYPALARRTWGIDKRELDGADIPTSLQPDLSGISAALGDWAASLGPDALYRLWRAAATKG